MSRRRRGRPDLRASRVDDRRRTPDLSPARRRLFWVILFASPWLLLGAAEVVCRACGFGGYPPAIAAVGAAAGRTWYGTQRRGTDVFFGVGRAAPGGGMREIQWASPKPAGTVRIAFLGESAIQGFPQSLPLTNGSFLESMLRDAWGGTHRVEVLNFGATAVASFPVRQLLHDVLNTAEPDLVVLMVGNNEFYGAYGVQSLPRLAWSPAGMRCTYAMRRLGLVQWLASLGRDSARTGAPLMERAGAGTLVRPNDPRRRAALRSLQADLDDMVQRCTRHKVPVIVCTVPTNERGLAPIGSDREPDSTTAVGQARHAAFAQAQALLQSDPARAVEAAAAAERADSTRAAVHWLRGQALSRLGRHDEARQEYIRARDLDTMPWRTTSAAQQAVRSAAGRGAVLCDMEAAFRAASPGGAIGWELLDDHVHMSLRGQALFATTLLACMAGLPEPLRVTQESRATLPDWEAYAAAAGRSLFSEYSAAEKVRKLFAIGFMRRNNEAAFQSFESRCNELLAGMSEADRAAVQRWNDPSLHGASERPLEFVAGVYRLGEGDYANAARLFEIARRSVPPISLWRLEATWSLLTCNRRLRDAPAAEDVALCREMIRIGELLQQYGGAGNPDVMRLLGLAYNMAGDFAAAIPRLEGAAPNARGKDGWEVISALTDSYLQVGRAREARELLERATRDPQMAEAAQRFLDRLSGGAAAR